MTDPQAPATPPVTPPIGGPRADDNANRREARSMHVRATANEAREVTGLGVPYGETITIWGERERLAPGSVDADGAKLFYRHSEPIGVVTAATDDASGWHPTAKISATARGDEAYQLARDGVLDGLSIGFDPIEWHIERDDDGQNVTVYDKVRVREVSLVPFPAYPSARVKSVRHEPTTNRKDQAMPPENTDTQERADDLRELREQVQDVQRSLTIIRQRSDRDEDAAPADRRSVGEVLKAIVQGDEATIRQLDDLRERAYEGGTTADAVMKPGWVGDLTRIFDASSGVLVESFSSGTLPDAGETIEFAELDTNTLAVNKQAAQGDDIAMGKVKIKTRTASVSTYAGGGELSRQSIERATVGVLNTTILGLTIAAGARKKAEMRATYDALVTARKALAADAGVLVLGKTLAASTADDWENALIDAAIRFEALNLTLDRGLVSATVFKKLRSLTVAGERVFKVAEDNASGVLDLPGLSGAFASLPIRLDTGQAGDSFNFTNKLALRAYDSPLVSLSDEKITNLTKQFAVYKYGAIADEIPAGVLPVKFA